MKNTIKVKELKAGDIFRLVGTTLYSKAKEVIPPPQNDVPSRHLQNRYKVVVEKGHHVYLRESYSVELKPKSNPKQTKSK